MGRNVKPGISFYRLDAGHVLDKKVRFIYNDYGAAGYYIWSCIIDYAYSNNGYFFDAGDNDELELFASEYCKEKLGLVKEVITGCIRRGLFDKTVADVFEILTSRRMQDNFLTATKERRKNGAVFNMFSEFIVTGENMICHENISICPVTKEYSSRDKSTDKKRLEESEIREENSSVATAPVEPVIPKKIKIRSQKAVEHWGALVGAWKTFYAAKFSDEKGRPVEPEFSAMDGNFLKKISSNLKRFAIKEKKEWTEKYAVQLLIHFLNRAWQKDEWLKQNFQLSILYSRYNSIVTSKPQQNGSTNGHSSQQPAGIPAATVIEPGRKFGKL